MTSAQMIQQQEQEDKRSEEHERFFSQNRIVNHVATRTRVVLDEWIETAMKEHSHIDDMLADRCYPSSTREERNIYHPHSSCSEEAQQASVDARIRYDEETNRLISEAGMSEDEAQLGHIILTRLWKPYFAEKREFWRPEAEEQARRWVMGE